MSTQRAGFLYSEVQKKENHHDTAGISTFTIVEKRKRKSDVQEVDATKNALSSSYADTKISRTNVSHDKSASYEDTSTYCSKRKYLLDTKMSASAIVMCLLAVVMLILYHSKMCVQRGVTV